ncbi:MAG: bifunctional 3,4-dihydroxy-2-butanone-4-phosphate synthase/GTP cyclohydrolase II [Actinobacteria bacterium]|nr:bifunctional 3,4-dihydroxy-2-butanone-4-phosphate synthase/GTP cyclohydrolase II [Actinomycetota bacterium]
MPHRSNRLATIEDAIAAVKRGEIIVVVDDEDRENEGDLIMAAEFATPEAIAFFVRHTSGVICAPLTGERCDQLDLPLMVERNTESMRTAFTDTVDYIHGTSTGISASDRAITLRALADPATTRHDLARPGHIFPLRARTGGVLKRAGHTEAAVDFCRLAGLEQVGVLCEIVNPDGTMSRMPELEVFAEEHGLLLCTIADLIRYRRRTEKLIERVGEARLPTPWGEFRSIAYRSLLDDVEHLALVLGDPAAPTNQAGTVVRVHSECLTGDIFGSLRCDCGDQLHAAMGRIAEEGNGVLVYLRGHEGRGIGIGHKIRAYSLQDGGLDTVEANTALGLPVDSREYGIGAQILSDLGVTRMRLVTNNPSKYGGLEGFGLEITDRVGIDTTPTAHNLTYLRTKRDRLGHLIDLPDAAE